MTSQCKMCSLKFTYYPSNKAGIYCSIRCCNSDPERNKRAGETKRGRPTSQIQKNAVSKAMLGKPKTKESIAKGIASRKKYFDRVGRKLDKMTSIRTSRQYQEWRKQVFERDNYSCLWCGDNTGGNLEADHIISLSFLIEESKLTGFENYYDIDNGRTLCSDCHKTTNSYARHWKHHVEGKLMLAITDSGGEYYEQTESLITQLKEKLE